MTKKQEESEN